MGRRAYMEALAYARRREAYGQHVSDFSMVAKNLATMKLKQMAATLCVFQSWRYVQEKNIAEDVLVPALKYTVSVHGSWMAREAILVLGGNGIIMDFSILPRLMNDNIINETWEGTHNILGDHVMKALRRPKLRDAFFRELDSFDAGAEQFPQLEAAIRYYRDRKQQLKEYARDSGSKEKNLFEMNILPMVDFLYETFSIGLFLREAVCDLRKNDDTFFLFLQAYLEILNRKADQMVSADQVFSRMDKLEKIINY